NGPNRWQLYNLKDDKGETHDLAKQYPEKLDELLKEWATYVKENGVIENVQQRRLLQNDQLEPFEA
ncbi:arylsulfatase, partial [Acinetobacter baumannii]